MYRTTHNSRLRGGGGARDLRCLRNLRHVLAGLHLPRRGALGLVFRRLGFRLEVNFPSSTSIGVLE